MGLPEPRTDKPVQLFKFSSTVKIAFSYGGLIISKRACDKVWDSARHFSHCAQLLPGPPRSFHVTPLEVKMDTTALLKALEADMPAEIYKAAYAKGISLDLDEVAQQLLDEDSAPWSTASS